MGALDNVKARILQNGDILIVKERAVSQTYGPGKLKELFRAISKNAPKSEKGEKVICRNEVMAECAKRLEDWNNGETT